MYELIQATETAYYIDCASKIGIVRTGDCEVCLIDSGSDKDVGRKIMRVLQEKGWKLMAIFNTHSHADHIGANKYLQSQTGCKVYAPGMECDFTNHPILEPSFLYGAYPCKELCHKFLLAQECEAEPLRPEVLPECLEAVELPGHSFEMVGYRTSDGAFFIADCLSSRETLDKYGISFIYDVERYLSTLRSVRSESARVFIPSHAAVCEDLSWLIDYNIDKVRDIALSILSLCENPISFEELLQKLFVQYGLTMNFQQYVLVGSTVRSYLSYLKGQGSLAVEFCDSMLLWKRV